MLLHLLRQVVAAAGDFDVSSISYQRQSPTFFITSSEINRLAAANYPARMLVCLLYGAPSDIGGHWQWVPFSLLK